MNYELASELKEARFPIHEYSGEYESCYCGAESSKECVPTLEELIEACGDRVKRIEKKRSLWHAVEADECCDDPRDYFGYCHTSGKTPEEAVARLWLALNKK